MKDSRDTAVIEIIESHTTEAPPVGKGFIIPSEVRINGQSLWCPLGEQIEVHGVKLNGKGGEDAVQVTLTLFARRVFLGHASESPETPERRVQDAQRRLAAAQAELTAAHEAAREAVAEQAPA